METANQLSLMVNQLETDIPKYRGVWSYDKYHPGFVDDLTEMIQAVRRRIEDGDVWGAYDDWHLFMRHWDRELDPPLWAQVGTVVVEGPGPTVTAAYNPGRLKSVSRHHPKAEAAAQVAFDMNKEYLQFFKALTMKVIRRKLEQTGKVLPGDQVAQEVIQTAKTIEFDPTKEQDPDWAWTHYFELIIKNVGEKFGVNLDD